MTLITEIIGRLTTQGVGSTSAGSTGWLLQGRALTSTQAQVIAVIPTGGNDQEPTEDLDQPTFQLVGRGASTSGTELEVQVEAAIRALNLFSGTLGNYHYVDIQKVSDMGFLGYDENHRPLYGVNFVAYRSRTT